VKEFQGVFFLNFREVQVKSRSKPVVPNRRALFVRKPGVIATSLAISLMAGHAAYAQEAIEKIEVTGTRIPPKNIESAGSPSPSSPPRKSRWKACGRWKTC
jgi:hypothetical protein